MRQAALVPEGAPHGRGAKPLQTGAFVGDGGLHIQIIDVDVKPTLVREVHGILHSGP